jgi:Na+/melibiose symporter-like transporter
VKPDGFQVFLVVFCLFLIGFKVSGIINPSWSLVLIPFYIAILPITLALIALAIVVVVAQITGR